MYSPRSYAQYQTLPARDIQEPTAKSIENVVIDVRTNARGGNQNAIKGGFANTMIKAIQKAPGVFRPSTAGNDGGVDAKPGAVPPSKSPRNGSPSRASSPKQLDESDTGLPDRMQSATVPVPSRPVVIPSRSTTHFASRPHHSHTVRVRGEHGGHPSRRGPLRTRTDTSKHNPKAMAPAVAALLAVTSIPPPRRTTRRRPPPNCPDPSNVDELIRHWREEAHESGDRSAASTFLTNAHLDLLLEPPRPTDTTVGASANENCGNESDSDTVDPDDQPRSVRSSLPRSISSCSIPSLEPSSACQSFSSVSFSGPNVAFSPATLLTISPSSTASRREKCVTSPCTEACADSHPLASPVLDPADMSFTDSLQLPDPALSNLESPSPEPATPAPTPSKSRKSNLTASLSALRATLLSSPFLNPDSDRSASPDAAPEPESLLTRSPYGDVRTRRFSSEMRPRWSWSAEMSVPENVRRYLNPAPPATSSSSRFRYLSTSNSASRDVNGASRRGSNIAVEPGDVHRDANLALRAEEPAGEMIKGKMILLRTYGKSGGLGERRTSSPIPPPSVSLRRRRSSLANKPAASESERAATADVADGQPIVRPREPRENSDFLRVIVLEMNMRRVGKLDRRAGGRARIWLPPRVVKAGGTGVEDKEKDGGKGRVPERWRGWNVDEEWEDER